MDKERNNGGKNLKKEDKIPNRFSRRDFYMNRKKIPESINTKNEESNKIPKKTQITKTKKEKKIYIHHSQPKVSFKKMNFEINGGLAELKKNKSFKSLINIETITEKIISSKKGNNKYIKNNKKVNSKGDKLNKSNSVKNIQDKIKTSKVINNTTKSEKNTINENKITVNIKKDITTTKNIPNDDKSNENKYKRTFNYKSPENIHLKQNINNTINNKPKINSKPEIKTNINIVPQKVNEVKNIQEEKNDKTQNEIDKPKSQSKNPLIGGPKKECNICHEMIETHLYKIHAKNVHLSQIFSWLYLGSFANACDLKELKRTNIKYILNCAVECKNENLPKDIKELHLKLVDEPEFNITKYFDQTNEFINKVRTAGGALLVHCKVGLSRSPTVIIAYLIKYYEFTVDSAMRFMKRKRPQIIPNEGFIQQLKEYEKKFEKKFKKKSNK